MGSITEYEKFRLPDITLYSWSKDENGKFISCNELFAKLAQIDSPEEMIGKTDYDVAWRNFAEFYLTCDQIALNGAHYKGYEYSGSVESSINLFTTKSPLINKDGNIVGTIGSAIDVTNLSVLCKLGRFDASGRFFLGPKFGNTYLTKREVCILKYVLLGRTAKLIGKKLNISHRTVESYMESIKHKLMCDSKSDIHEKAMQYGLSHLCFLSDK